MYVCNLINIYLVVDHPLQLQHQGYHACSDMSRTRTLMFPMSSVVVSPLSSSFPRCTQNLFQPRRPVQLDQNLESQSLGAMWQPSKPRPAHRSGIKSNSVLTAGSPPRPRAVSRPLATWRSTCTLIAHPTWLGTSSRMASKQAFRSPVSCQP